jgi:hypothetical protein
LKVIPSSVVPLAQMLAWAVCSGVNVVTGGSSGLPLNVSHILTLAMAGALGALTLLPPQALKNNTGRTKTAMHE